MITFEGAEGALKVVLDLGAVPEEVFVDEVVGVAGDFLHADGEVLVGFGVGFRIFGLFGAFGEMRFIEGLEPGSFGAGEAMRDPVALDEALDEDLVDDAVGLEVVEDGFLEFAIIVRAFEGEDDQTREKGRETLRLTYPAKRRLRCKLKNNLTTARKGLN